MRCLSQTLRSNRCSVYQAKDMRGLTMNKKGDNEKYCSICKAKYGWLFGPSQVECGLCNASICNNCARDTDYYAQYICVSCAAVNPDIEVWSSRYKGRLPAHSASYLTLTSRWYKDKDLAIWELKYWAAKNNFDIIYDLDFKTEKKGYNYIFTVWQASGKAARLEKNSGR